MPDKYTTKAALSPGPGTAVLCYGFRVACFDSASDAERAARIANAESAQRASAERATEEHALQLRRISGELGHCSGSDPIAEHVCSELRRLRFTVQRQEQQLMRQTECIRGIRKAVPSVVDASFEALPSAIKHAFVDRRCSPAAPPTRAYPDTPAPPAPASAPVLPEASLPLGSTLFPPSPPVPARFEAFSPAAPPTRACPSRFACEDEPRDSFTLVPEDNNNLGLYPSSQPPCVLLSRANVARLRDTCAAWLDSTEARS